MSNYLNVTTRTRKETQQTIQFYASIGFRVFEAAPDDATPTWLHLFASSGKATWPAPLPPFSALLSPALLPTVLASPSGGVGNGAASANLPPVALRVTPMFDLQQPAGQEQGPAAILDRAARLVAHTGQDPVVGAAFNLIVLNVQGISDRLTACGFESVVYPTTGGSTLTLVAFDPVGNLVSITDNVTTSPFFALAAPKSPAANGGLNVNINNKHAPPNTYEAVPALSLDALSLNTNTQLDAYLPLDHVPIVHDASASLVSLTAVTRKKIGVLTSGGDSSGMNAAVRAVARIALQRGCVPFAIHEGYEGLVEGGALIRRLGWDDVRGYLSLGGTVIGTARSARFRTREGRLLAAFNMIKNGIDALVVCGGDGSLTGADLLRSEWTGLVDELIETGRLVTSECQHLRTNLTIVGLVGSIDNDMSSTDITIGAYTSLHRICESLDSLTSTAMSHQRAFVVEVMGRHCGWLALMAAISVGADWVFLPERPPPLDSAKYGANWEDEMCERLSQNRKLGSRITLVIICEGAIDQNLNPIKPDYVKSVLDSRLGFDTRVTNLGHVQRGGAPCAYDRYLATVQGVEAVEAVLRSTPETPAPMIGMSQHRITAGPLMDAVKLTHEVAEAISKKDFKKAMDLRDPDFTRAYDAYIESHLIGDNHLPESRRLRIGIIHTGAPAGGMNTATRIAARLCLNRGHTPLAIKNGFSGLCRGEISALSWHQVIGWQTKGGSELGTNRDHPLPVPGTYAANLDISDAYATSFIDCGRIAFFLQKYDIEALMIIGGFEAYTSLITLDAARSIYPAFCIPMINLPATVSNNVPGTDFSLGSDTALNTIVECTDRIKQSATSSQKRVFIIEVQGGNCGYLAVLGGLASGATTAYIPEEGISLDMLQRDVKHLNARYERELTHSARNEGRVIIRAEAACSTYTTNVISDIFRHEGKGLFDSRTAVLGHLQQGGVPSPLDRVRATRLSVECIDWIERSFLEAQAARSKDENSSKDGVFYSNLRSYTNKSTHACVIGIQGAEVLFTPVQVLLDETDMNKRRGTKAWWMGLTRLIKVLSKYHYEDPVE
ncbi:6-phosphofructokinase, alpha subunit [Physocladia obscura]|uniref:ATP-dependent 6-phosphofructokinase n=1 Tax=Physocladia obscura TaxID=109957 RepID=A0AAD5T894_9FUNG|nr:6-phosphofructokinase, alpha subunit [Physocladia obscura]